MFRNDAPLKAHPDYRAAKAGDAAAAVRLVLDLAEALGLRIAGKFPPETIFVAPHAREATGDNAIPQVLARAMANLAGGQVDLGIRAADAGVPHRGGPDGAAQQPGAV